MLYTRLTNLEAADFNNAWILTSIDELKIVVGTADFRPNETEYRRLKTVFSLLERKRRELHEKMVRMVCCSCATATRDITIGVTRLVMNWRNGGKRLNRWHQCERWRRNFPGRHQLESNGFLHCHGLTCEKTPAQILRPNSTGAPR